MIFSESLIIGIVFGSLLSGWLLSLVCIRMLGILQQEGYAAKPFLKWCFKKGNLEERRLVLLSISLGLLVALFNLCFCFWEYKIANLISVVPFAGWIVFYYVSERKRALKVKTNPTKRFIRLAVCNFLFLSLISCGLGFACAAAAMAIDEKWYYLFRFVYFALLPLALPLVIALSGSVMKLYEIPHGKKYLRKSKKLLAQSSCKMVGITGSYGKTSVKNFAYAILSTKYRVIATPASYNTPLGIARAVSENGLDCDIFLAEMGARKTGDIRELCDMVNPEYGVVTGVCCQHLESFGSLKNIQKEKGVLAMRAQKVVLGSSVETEKEGALKEGVDFAAEDVALSTDGVGFTLRIKEDRIPVQTPLLGRHAAEDIALASALCYLLGMSFEEIAAGIKNIQPVPHRLQKSEANGVTILDDSYNSNVEGAKVAVETLKLFGGKKYVVTPGLVELGLIEEKKNEELGALFLGLDGVILVGETRVLPLRNGFLKAGGEEEKVVLVPSLHKAQLWLGEHLAAGDTVLFLNDLPDKY